MSAEIADSTFNETHNSISLDDPSVSVTNTDGAGQGVMFSTLDIAPFKPIFSKFNCVALALNLQGEGGTLNLDDIDRDEHVVKLHINTYYTINVVHQRERVYFPMLRELSVLWKFPAGFPDLSGNTHLCALTVQYEKGSSDQWLRLPQVQDLVIHEYDEDDLTALNGLTGLVRLKLIKGKMKSLRGIEQLPNLETLCISTAAKLTDVQPLLAAPKLVNVLFESYKKVTDWSFFGTKPTWNAISLGLADSLDFMRDLPQLQFLYCKNVVDREGKKFLFSTTQEQDRMVPEGVKVKYDYTYPDFYKPLDCMK